MKQHFFMFSQGSYSDYGVRGMYLCDHDVDEKEWDQFYKDWRAELIKVRDTFNTEIGYDYSRTPNCQESFEWKAYQEFQAISPEELFQKLHGMVEVEYKELWRDC
jgi:predicted HD phosphohydrolase